MWVSFNNFFIDLLMQNCVDAELDCVAPAIKNSISKFAYKGLDKVSVTTCWF